MTALTLNELLLLLLALSSSSFLNMDLTFIDGFLRG